MSAASNTVDLSLLPAPIIVEQLAYETILSQMIATLQTLLPSFDATVDSDPAVKVLQLAAYREQLLRAEFGDAARGMLLAYAAGPVLDQIGALVDVARLVITPADPVTGAPAVMESDDSFRARVVLAPESFSVAGPELAYIYFAKSASADVLDATATSPVAGTVQVTVLSRDGDGTASADLLAAVTAALSPRDKRPCGDFVTVASAAIVPFTVAARLYLFEGPDASLLQSAAAAGLAAYLADCRKLGRDVTLSGLYAAMQVAGVQRVELDQPTGSIVINETQAAWCTGASIVVAGNAD